MPPGEWIGFIAFTKPQVQCPALHKSDMVMHSCDPRSHAWNHEDQEFKLWLQRKFEVILGCMRTYLTQNIYIYHHHRHHHHYHHHHHPTLGPQTIRTNALLWSFHFLFAQQLYVILGPLSNLYSSLHCS